MREIVLKNEYNIHTLGLQTKFYGTLVDRFETLDEDVLIDFKGIHTVEPWKNLLFCELLFNEHIYMRLYGDASYSSNIEAVMKLMGCKNLNRVENVLSTVESIDYAYVNKIKTLKCRFEPSISFIGDKLNVDIVKSGITSLSSKDTVTALFELVKSKCDDNIKEVFLNFSGVIIASNMFSVIADNINDTFFIDKGILVTEFDDVDKDKEERIKSHRIMKAGEILSDEDRLSILKASGIDVGTVVVLSIFKKTRGTNEFGQMNDGVPIISRLAILTGINKKYDSETLLSFKSFKRETLKTREAYFIDSDMLTELEEMDTQVFEFKISDIGYSSKFTGKLAHFNLPIQFDDKGYIDSVVVNGESIISVRFTLPNYAKHVFDSWGIEYNKELLDDCIKTTNNILGLE